MISPEKKEAIQVYFESILAKCNSCQQEAKKKRIKKAFDFAYDAHAEHRRKSGEPYIYHPLAVAEIAVEHLGLGTTSFISALLHDVVEDTDYTIEDIRGLFGNDVAYIVDGLTKISDVVEGKSLQIENYKKILLTMSRDVRVILVKLADRLHNLRTMDAMPERKRAKMVSETLLVYIPLAHRLGLYPIKTEMEDHCLHFQNPTIFDDITQKLKNIQTDIDTFVERFVEPLLPKLDATGVTYEIKARTKSVSSIYRKMTQKGVDFDEVYDIFAIRIIYEPPLPTAEKFYAWSIYSVITDEYSPRPDRLRDWISTPKENGYESLHTTVMSNEGRWVEVQIRSKRMDDIAEYGYAAHWKYKEHQDKESEIDNWINKIRELLDVHLSQENNEQEIIDSFKIDIFSKDILVFTPKGEMKKLPKGATALDFAFEIHSEIGYHAIGAKINFKSSPLSTVLNSGDQVEIITSTGNQPEKEWLNFVTTTKAKAKIKEAFKEERRKHIEQGKQELQQTAKAQKIPLNSVVLSKLVNHFNVKDKDELYCKIGSGVVDLTDFKKIAKQKRRNKYMRYWKIQLSKITPGGKKKVEPVENKQLALADSLDEAVYRFASCCNPIPGDDVVGVDVDGVVEVHKRECEILKEILAKDGFRGIDVLWKEYKVKSFLARIHIYGLDRIGILHELTDLLSKRKYVNMRSVNIDSVNGFFDGYLDVYVHNKEQLEDVMSEIRKIKGLKKVERIELDDAV